MEVTIIVMPESTTQRKLTTLLLACTIGLCTIATTSAAANLAHTSDEAAMPTFSVKYILENDFITAGEASLKLTKQADHYQLILKTEPSGVFRLAKKGKVREIAKLPTLNPPFLSAKYEYTNFGDQDRSYTSTFNRQSGEATIVRDGKTKRIAMDTNAVDRLSMTLEIMQQLRDQPDIESFAINAIDNKGTKTFNFISRGQTQLKTDIGRLTTTRIDRQRHNSNRNTITWFAALGPEAIPVPVQIEQYKSGKLVVRLKITRFNFDN